MEKVLQAWPRGTVAVHAWLDAQGVSRKLAEQYRRRGWIDAVGRGAFVRRGDKVEWPGAMYSIQEALGKRIHAGGRTALEFHGLAHVLSFSTRAPVFIYGAPDVRLPSWFIAHDWHHPMRYSATGLFLRDLFLTPQSLGDFAIKISSPERAVLEYLAGFPRDASFEEAQELVDVLTTPRPEVFQALLEACTSVKVKRMFLYLADRAKHPWRAKLKHRRIELGSGKRSLVRAGKFERCYQITVPAKCPELDA